MLTSVSGQTLFARLWTGMFIARWKWTVEKDCVNPLTLGTLEVVSCEELKN